MGPSLSPRHYVRLHKLREMRNTRNTRPSVFRATCATCASCANQASCATPITRRRVSGPSLSPRHYVRLHKLRAMRNTRNTRNSIFRATRATRANCTSDQTSKSMGALCADIMQFYTDPRANGLCMYPILVNHTWDNP